MVKWGVIGAGGIARRRTIPEGIAKAKNAELVAVMDIDEKITKDVADEYKVKAYTKEEELLDDKNVQAVYIATPVNLHCKQIIAAANKEKHILCEKSMAMTVEECEKMIKVCRDANVKLGLGYMMRFHTIHTKIKEMIQQGLLGRIVMARAQLSCWYPEIQGAWRQKKELGGGGSLIDMGIHCIDLLEFILDSKVAEVSCFTGNLIQKYEVEDTAIVMMRFENSAQGVVDNCFSIPDESSKNMLEIYGTNGSVLCKGTIGQGDGGEAISYIEEVGKQYGADQKREPVSSSKMINPKPINTYQAEIEHFSDCIINDTEPSISGEDGMWSQRVGLACYESASTGKVVKINNNNRR